MFCYFQANMGLSLNYCFLSWKERRLVTQDTCYQYTNNSKPIIEWKIIAAESELQSSQRDYYRRWQWQCCQGACVSTSITTHLV